MEKYQVIKIIKEGGNIIAREGEILYVYMDYRRIGGQKVLMKEDEYICDVGSELEKENCKKL
ncbi:hypothetical protein AAGG74_14935 [Bacillus mexicanus]|uniref:hypothetical protein n=1 Tax=Bacillus mexicanus TaxID=2834415 RepID=UPI003D19DFDE